MHYRRKELIALDLPVRADRHLARHAQAVDRGLERTQLVRQLLGQHRDDAPRKIDRRAAIARVAVEGVAVGDIVADVSDCDDQAETLGAALAIDGVVESRAVSPSIVTSGRAVKSVGTSGRRSALRAEAPRLRCAAAENR
jgi:hypothetical protein